MLVSRPPVADAVVPRTAHLATGYRSRVPRTAARHAGSARGACETGPVRARRAPPANHCRSGTSRCASHQEDARCTTIHHERPRPTSWRRHRAPAKRTTPRMRPDDRGACVARPAGHADGGMDRVADDIARVRSVATATSIEHRQRGEAHAGLEDFATGNGRVGVHRGSLRILRRLPRVGDIRREN